MLTENEVRKKAGFKVLSRYSIAGGIIMCALMLLCYILVACGNIGANILLTNSEVIRNSLTFFKYFSIVLDITEHNTLSAASLLWSYRRPDFSYNR